MRRKAFQDALPNRFRWLITSSSAASFARDQFGDENRLDPETVATTIHALGRDARVLPSADAIADLLAAEAAPGDLLLIMSNGSFDGLCDKLLKKLSAKRTPTEAHAR